jgi:Putative amidoligase enzyme
MPASTSLYSSRPPASKMPTGIVSAGVEFECFFDDEHSLVECDEFVERCPRATVSDDGSIESDDSDFDSTREYTFWSTDPREIVEWMRRIYEYGAVTNSSCGFHIHVKPEAERTWRFATRHYWDEFERRYRAFANARDDSQKYLDRMDNDYSAMTPWSRSFIRALLNEEARFTAVNLGSLLKHNYGTVEHRIMPHQENSEEAAVTLLWLLQTVSSLITRPKVPVEPEQEAPLLVAYDPLWPDSSVNDEQRKSILKNQTTKRKPAKVGAPQPFADDQIQ